jgi:hypothetical protein
MSDAFSSHVFYGGMRTLYDLPTTDKPTIKILLYTDSPTTIVKESVGSFGLGRMIAQLKTHQPAFANVEVTWVGRYSFGSNLADNKIHVVLARELEKTGQPFDEIWIFGLHQVNKARLNLGLGGGGPESELDANEVNAIRDWMDQGGGVLVTGDHANKRPKDALPHDPTSNCADPFDKEPYLSLGRALGRCIPRAGLMRDWEGSPTASEDDSNDSEVVTSGLPINTFPAQIIFQRDRVPQQLILQKFDERGLPALRGQPHPLFFYPRDRVIELFPDHLHEGAVTIPDEFDDKIWPKNADGIQPRPQVVAYGLDKRSGQKFNLLATYDGDGVGVGRIVADSSWHHYFNVNLSEFGLPAQPDSASDQIGQFYGNLALWLCPAKKRLGITHAMSRWLVQEPLVLEGLGGVPAEDFNDKLRAGRSSHQILSRLACPCEIHELLSIAIPETYRYLDPSGTLFFSARSDALSFLPSQELMLGCIINRYSREVLEKLNSTLSDSNGEMIKSVLADACYEAFDTHERNVAQWWTSYGAFLNEARLKTAKLSKQ